MKTAATALLLSTLAWSAYGSDKWNDALSSPTISTPDVIAIHSEMNAPASSSVESPVTSPLNGVAMGRKIIIGHLNQIKTSQLMINTITLEPYWQGVFAASGHPELYTSSQVDIQVALEAGLSPYLRGQPLTAEQFANAAIAALEKSPTNSVAAAPEQNLFRH